MPYANKKPSNPVARTEDTGKSRQPVVAPTNITKELQWPDEPY